MFANTTTAGPVIELGTVVDARPWKLGVELPAQRGVVVSLDMGWEGYVSVWFPGRGLPAIGRSVSAVLRSKLINPRSAADLPKTWVTKVCRMLRTLNRAPLFSLPDDVMDYLPGAVCLVFQSAERGHKAADTYAIFEAAVLAGKIPAAIEEPAEPAWEQDLLDAASAPAVPVAPLVDLEGIGRGEGTIVFARQFGVFLDVRRDHTGWSLAIVGKQGSVRIEAGQEYERAWVVLPPSAGDVRVLAGEARQLVVALDQAVDILA
jgi:hypothetical protein